MIGVITIVRWEHVRRDTPHQGFLITEWFLLPRAEIRGAAWAADQIVVHTTFGKQNVSLYMHEPYQPGRLGNYELGSYQDMMSDLCCHDTDVDILWEHSPRTHSRWLRSEDKRFERPQPPQGDHVVAK